MINAEKYTDFMINADKELGCECDTYKHQCIVKSW